MENLELKTQAVPAAAGDTARIVELTKIVETYRSFIKASNTGTWEFFVDSGFLHCNEIYFILLGLSLNDFDQSGKENLKELWVDLLHPDDREQAVSHFAAYLADPGEKMYENFFRLKHSNGSWVWIWSRGRFTPDVDGNNNNRVIGTHIDVTDYKKAEEEIQLERSLLRTLIDNLPDRIYVKDTGGRKIISNHADVASVNTRSETDVIGKTDLELFDGDIGRRGYHDDMDVIQSGGPILNKEEFFFDREGNKQWILTSKVPVKDELGKVSRIIGIGHNITERKKNEEHLEQLNEELTRQSQELNKQAADLKKLNEQLTLQKEQELEKAIAQGKFESASEVLHDIGNALVGFGSYLNRINRVLDKNSADAVKNLNLFVKQQQITLASAIGTDKANALVTITDGIAKTQTESNTEIGASVHELVNIITHIQEILNIQRQFVRGHGGVHERKPINLGHVIDDCKAMLLAAFDKKGIQLITSIQPGRHIIKGDHTKLMQVLLNVLKNGVEAMEFGAPEKKITISLATVNNKIELKIADNGHGFDHETGLRLFERGFTTKESGTGIGLYNFRSIVESHSGTFEIKSDGRGLGAVTTINFSV